MTLPATTPRLFDPGRIDAHRRRARRLVAARPGADFLMTRACEDLADRLAVTKRRFETSLDLASPTDAPAAVLATAPSVGSVRRLPASGHDAGGAFPSPEPASADLVVSLLALQFLDDLPGALASIRRALKPGGLFLAALIGGDTLTELRRSLLQAESDLAGGAAARVAPFVEVKSLGALLQRAGFALPVADVDRVTVRYSSLPALVSDLRAMGATAPLASQGRPLRRDVFVAAAAAYADAFADPDGRLRATFDILWASGWAPD